MATAAVAPPGHPASQKQILPRDVFLSQLNKKASFEAAVTSICNNIQSLDPADLQYLVRRSKVVSTSRFSTADIPLWKAALRLVRASKAVLSGSNIQQELINYEEACLAVLSGDNTIGGDGSSADHHRPSSSSLFEGQLTSENILANGNTENTHTGISSDLASFLLGLQPPPTTTTSPTATNQEQEEQHINEALQRQLDQIAIQIMEESGAAAPRPPPPASKYVLKSLPRTTVTEETMKELEGSTCPVCMSLELGDEITRLPCHHFFHSDTCLKPWLESTNTCPTCRHELQTDDDRYEREKKRKEERKGAENATNDGRVFLYL